MPPKRVPIRRRPAPEAAATLKESGLVVYRPVDTPAIFAARRALQIAGVSAPALQWRGEGHHRAETFSVITNTEIRDQKQLQDIPYEDAQEALYYAVPSLQRRFETELVDVRILHRRTGQSSDAIALIPERAALDELHQERIESLQVLGDLALNGNFNGFWQHHIPHLSMTYVPHNVGDTERQNLLDCIAETLPQPVTIFTASIRHARTLSTSPRARKIRTKVRRAKSQ